MIQDLNFELHITDNLLILMPKKSNRKETEKSAVFGTWGLEISFLKA